jgi:peptide/nickel transport system ATP-binding protein
LRAGILSLLADLRRETGVSLLYITHDLLSARLVTDELLVMSQGRIVERGETKQVLQHPRDEYTRTLLAAIPNPFAGEHSSPDIPTPSNGARPPVGEQTTKGVLT